MKETSKETQEKLKLLKTAVKRAFEEEERMAEQNRDKGKLSEKLDSE